MATRGRVTCLQKDVQLYRRLGENKSTAHLIYIISKHLPDWFIFSAA